MARTRLGILGGGQLGRMLALAAVPLDVEVYALDPAEAPPIAAVLPAGRLYRGEWDDPAALAWLAEHCDVVTWEFENVPASTTAWLAERLPVYPSPRALEIGNDRLTEKDQLTALGIETAPYRRIDGPDDIARAAEELGRPMVLKTRRFGYDGKGQRWIRESDGPLDAAACESIWADLGGVPIVAEAAIPFVREVSILMARDQSGRTVVWSLAENRHEAGILRRTVAPAPDVSPAIQQQAESWAQALLAEYGYVGVLCLECFEHEGRLIANETATRVHNSGHWSIEGATTSQFANHVRAVIGDPLGEVRAVPMHAVMHNLIGRLPSAAQRSELLAIPGLSLHLYGKSERPGRKLGHCTIVAATLAHAREASDLAAAILAE